MGTLHRGHDLGDKFEKTAKLLWTSSGRADPDNVPRGTQSEMFEYWFHVEHFTPKQC